MKCPSTKCRGVDVIPTRNHCPWCDHHFPPPPNTPPRTDERIELPALIAHRLILLPEPHTKAPA